MAVDADFDLQFNHWIDVESRPLARVYYSPNFIANLKRNIRRLPPMYDQDTCAETPRGAVGPMKATRQVTKLEQLEQQRGKMFEEIEEVTEAIELLKKHPEFEAYERYRQLTRRF